MTADHVTKLSLVSVFPDKDRDALLSGGEGLDEDVGQEGFSAQQPGRLLWFVIL